MSTLPHIRVGEFEGPLDLLLDEVRRQRVPIQTLQMAPLVARFLDYVSTAAERNLALDLEWLTMAATLIEWKARWLTRQGEDEAAPDGVRDEIVRQLQQHKKELAAELGRRREAEARGISRPGGMGAFRPAAAAEDRIEYESFLSVWDLEQQARALASAVQEYRVELAERRRFALSIAADEVSTAEMSAWLCARIDPVAPTDAVALLNQQPTGGRRAALFMAALELARAQQITLEQAEPFGALFIRTLSTSGSENASSR
jgi:segregation and condensation protein A